MKRVLKNKFFEKLLLAVCASAILVFCVDLTIPENEGKIYDSVIRLHILANSDDEEDQRIKLLVRDAILDECDGLFADTKTTKEAVKQMDAASDRMTEIAARVLAENGCDMDVRAVFGKEVYPTREYDGMTFPAGTYRSLRILIGNGEGHNWWCCLFPPLCLSSSTSEEALDSVGLDTDSGEVFVAKKYTVRFKLLEWLSCLFR